MQIVNIDMLILKIKHSVFGYFKYVLKIFGLFVKFFIIKFVGFKNCLLICARINTTHYENRQFRKYQNDRKPSSWL